MDTSTFLVANIENHEGFRAIRSELEANRLSDLEHILTLEDDRQILFAVSESRAGKKFLNLIDVIIDRAKDEIANINMGENLE